MFEDYLQQLKSLDFWKEYHPSGELIKKIGNAIVFSSFTHVFVLNDFALVTFNKGCYGPDQLYSGWYNVNVNYNGRIFSFKEVFENSSPDIQYKLLYHIDLLDY